MMKKLSEHRYEILIGVLLLLGCLVRIVGIQALPQGLNCDEASAGYEAFSLLTYGIDRNGNSFPVFLEAWGSGQNALYTYLMIPFVKCFGLNLLSTRLPMALLSCLSLFVWYKMLLQIKGKKFAAIGLTFLAICPWHIMKSRWGLESNVFPDLVLWSVYFVMQFLLTQKPSHLYIAMGILALTAYAYGTAYLFLPIFCVILFVYLLVTKKIQFRQAFISFVIVAMIDLPILGYLIINTFDLEQVSLGVITIPKLPVNRYEEQTSLFEGNVLLNVWQNFCHSVKLLVLQDDGLAWNQVSGYGMYYIVSVPFLIVGLVFCFKKNQLKNEFDTIINIWFGTAFLLLFALKEANINRINVLIFPLIYYIVTGLHVVLLKKNRILACVICLIYVLSFSGFLFAYCHAESENYWTFTDDVEDVIQYVNSLEKEIYFEYAFKEPYIYVLYYAQYDTKKFVETVEYFDENHLGNFENVKGFGKYHFYLTENWEGENVAYVIRKDTALGIDTSGFTVKEFEKYLVLEK